MRCDFAELLAFLLFVTHAAGVARCDPPLRPQPSEVAPASSAQIVKGLDRSYVNVIRRITSTNKASGARVFDDFEGVLRLDWQLLRPDPTHFSLAKHPGNLTISTQRGTIHLKRNLPKAKNILLLDNPFLKGPGCVVTTCLDGFRPREPFQQAGLIVYNADNYLKWVLSRQPETQFPIE